ncbi:MAG: hypothetical protein JST90_05040 [Bacteroidetes bacterium]|nr:hypothetical protein [Bacteroidota bacterium]
MASLRSILTSPMGILKLAIALCYIGLGVYLMVYSQQILSFVEPTYRSILSWVFIIYGAFRLIRALTDSPNAQNI